MMNKVLAAVVVLLVGSNVFLFMQQLKLKGKIAELEERLAANVSITPSVPLPHTGDSPFDNDHTDPMAGQMPKPANNAPATTISLVKTEHNFGTINEGDRVKTTFKFTNTGKEPLIIAEAIGSCGCTVPKWPKQAIEPGKGGEIEVEFDSNHKSGEQMKTVTLTANTQPAQTELVIKATVIPKDK